MKPIVKKAIAAVAIKKGIDKIQERRRPKRSTWSRMAPALMVIGIGGAFAYLAKSGRLVPMVDKAKAMAGGQDDQQAMYDESLRQPATAPGQ